MSEAERMSKPPDGNYGSAIARCLGTNRKHKGTGFRIGTDYVLTCAHVVRQCLGISKKTEEVLTAEVEGKTLEIDFPEAVNSNQFVEVVAELWRFQGHDIAVLRLTQSPPSSVKSITLKQERDYLGTWQQIKYQL